MSVKNKRVREICFSLFINNLSRNATILIGIKAKIKTNTKIVANDLILTEVLRCSCEFCEQAWEHGDRICNSGRARTPYKN